MKTKQYIEKYQLNKGWNKIHQNDFLQDLTSEFIVLLEYNKAEGNLLRFDNSVKAIKTKWDAISNKTPFGLPDGMWRYFFATTIAKMREQMCPEQMRVRREKQRRWEEYRNMKEQREREFWDSMNNVYERLLLSFLIISAVPTDAFSFMGLNTSATEDEIKSRYRELSLKMHPDKGGNQEDFLKLTECKNKCLKWAKR